MEYKIISTGSKGNAVVVDGRILIDCGVPFRRLESVYRDLDAVLLTHIHSDHFQPKTLARLAAERPSLRFFACPWLGPDLQGAGVPLRQITITQPDRWYDTGYCFVKACETKHNVQNCCWHIWFNDGSKVFYATDMGNLNGITAPYYDLYLVEANYRDEEIQAKIAEKKVNGEYIYEKRVLRDHMSEQDAIDWVYGNMRPDSTYPSNTDPKDMFISCGRMFAYVQNTIIRTCWQFLDKPMNRRLLDTITDTVNIWLNGLVGSGYLLGARVEISEDENPVTQLMAGIIKIHVYMTPASPAQEIDFVLEYDSSYVTSALTA